MNDLLIELSEKRFLKRANRNLIWIDEFSIVSFGLEVVEDLLQRGQILEVIVVLWSEESRSVASELCLDETMAHSKGKYIHYNLK